MIVQLLGISYVKNIKNISIFAYSLFLKLTAEQAEMDWVPVNLDSTAGEGDWAEQESFRTKFLLKNFCTFKAVIEPVIASFQKEPYSTAMTVSPRPGLYIYIFVVLSQNLPLKHVGLNANFVRLA